MRRYLTAGNGLKRNYQNKALHPKNHTPFNSLDKLAADPRILEIWDEGEDGIWAALVDGYNWEDCISLHEWTCTNLLKAAHMIEKNED